ncbi:MAG: hypothetical protein M1459_00880 [Patescibacteria group bacterium]|nr:hypothetical protein [Patescibacteria group bacterium]
MTPEERSLLERTCSLAAENNEILRAIRRSNRISTAMRVGYWVVIIALSFGAYYLIQPYLSLLTGISSGNVMNAQDAANQLRDLLK